MIEIDPSRTDLAEEFQRDPYAGHGAELQLLLNRMRRGPLKGRFVVVYTGDPPYTLARLTGVRGEGPVLLEDQTFESLRDVEWAVFKSRWKDLTGQDLALD